MKRDRLFRNRAAIQSCVGRLAPFLRKDPHPHIGERMEDIQKSYKKIGNPQNHEKGRVDDLAGIPGEDKDGSGDHDADDLHQAVKKKIAVETG